MGAAWLNRDAGLVVSLRGRPACGPIVVVRGCFQRREGAAKGAFRAMPTYISLVSWTEQGIRNLKESPARADATAELAASVGGKLVQLYWTVGPYDIVSIIEAPDDETAAALSLTVGSRGAVRTTTLRAFGREEFERIIAKVP
jgi:uncharacterized protein with GYD domain